jgi:Holliday junction resolvasome RuvABC endonuclease subunit
MSLRHVPVDTAVVRVAGEDAADALAVAITHANMIGSHR